MDTDQIKQNPTEEKSIEERILDEFPEFKEDQYIGEWIFSCRKSKKNWRIDANWKRNENRVKLFREAIREYKMKNQDYSFFYMIFPKFEEKLITIEDEIWFKTLWTLNFWESWKMLEFKKNVSFEYLTFEDKVYLTHLKVSKYFWLRNVTLYSDIHICYSKFEDKIDLTEIEFNKEKQQIFLIDCRYVKVGKLLNFSLTNPEDYSNVYIALYGADINYFVCDHLEFKNIKLYSEQVLTSKTDQEIQTILNFYERLNFYENHTYKDPQKNKKRLYEIYLHELRLMQDIFKKLNIHEWDDEFYYRIMQAQTKLAWIIDWENDKWFWRKNIKIFNIYWWKKIKEYFKIIVYEYCFGRGVKFLNIIISTFIIIILFSFIYIWLKYIWHNKWRSSFELSFRWFFDVLSLEFTEVHWWIKFWYYIEHILWIVRMTVFVAILSRKFMRM